MYPGQLEPTLLQSFIRAAKLRRWLGRPDCAPAIRECKILFDKGYAPTHNSDNNYYGLGTCGDDLFVDMTHVDIEDRRQVPIPNDLSSLIRGKTKVILQARFKHDGIVYSRSSTHLGNSLIHFYPNGVKTTLTPGTVKYIIRMTQDHILFAVQRHLDLPHNTLDPFAPYPHFPAKLYSVTLADLEIVEVDWIVSHFARWQISSEHVVVVSLSKVGINFCQE